MQDRLAGSGWLHCRPFKDFAAKGFAAAAAFLPVALMGAASAQAQEAAGGEANLKLPDLSTVQFLGVDGHRLLTFGLLFCVLGLIFGTTIFVKLKNLSGAPQHARDVRN